MATQNETMLAKVQAAIVDVLEGGQAIGILDRSYSLAPLETLRAMEKDYQKRVDKEKASNKTIKTFRVIPMDS